MPSLEFRPVISWRDEFKQFFRDGETLKGIADLKTSLTNRMVYCAANSNPVGALDHLQAIQDLETYEVSVRGEMPLRQDITDILELNNIL